MSRKLEVALSKALEQGFEEGWSDQQFDRVGHLLLEKHGEPGEAVVWDGAFGGSYRILQSEFVL